MLKVYPVPEEFKKQTSVDQSQLHEKVQAAHHNPEKFWAEQAHGIDWISPWTVVKNTSFHSPVVIEWFKGAKLNLSYNCVDRHAESTPDKVAFYWEPDHPEFPSEIITYKKLKNEVCRFANVLKDRGVKKGDRVTIYLPMIPEAVYALLACARIGAIHSVIFAGFSAEAIADRIKDCDSHLVITAFEGHRGGKHTHFKAHVDEALKSCPEVRDVLVITSTPERVHWVEGRDYNYNELRAQAAEVCPFEPMDAEDPLFILYTSGSTNKPKGVLHTTGGYIVQTSFTHKLVFDYKPKDVYWCTADVGWVTGHSYVVYGPLANGATSVIFEGVPTFPKPDRIWQIVDKYKVNQLYTAPTAIRALLKEGDQWLETSSRQSLKVLGSVGEPINPAAWEWYFEKVGKGRCPIVDTWWQTETGAIMISPVPGATPTKPGSATKPLPGVELELLNEQSQVLTGVNEGHLVIKDSWPAQARTIFQDHKRFEETYFSTHKGYYFTGDGARRDEEGDYWITGRVDDILNISGHRLGTAEIESALNSHPLVAESAVIGVPHSLKGQGMYCYLLLKQEPADAEALKKELVQHVRQRIGPVATPDVLHITQGLPKTRSGKIMRRILRKVAALEIETLGDTSTLADPQVVDQLIRERKNMSLHF